MTLTLSTFPKGEEFSNRARKKEAIYEWAEAADIYESAIPALVERGEILKAGETQERAAYCRYRAAYQAKTSEEFVQLITSASEAYGLAGKIFKKIDNDTPSGLLCTVHADYLASWLLEEKGQRLEALDNCIEVGKATLNSLEKKNDCQYYGKMCVRLLSYLYTKTQITLDWNIWKTIIEDAIDICEKAIPKLTDNNDLNQLAWIHHFYSVHLLKRSPQVYESLEKQDELCQRSLEHSETAVKNAESYGDPYLIGLTIGQYGYVIYDIKDDHKVSMECAKRQLELGKSTKDNYLLGNAYELLAYNANWITVLMAEDLDSKKEGYEEAINLADKAITHKKIILYPIEQAFIYQLDSLNNLAGEEVNLVGKREYLERSIDSCNKHKKTALQSHSPYGLFLINHSMSRALYLLSKTETDVDKKRKILTESALIRADCISTTKAVEPYNHWNLGIQYAFSALIKNQMAKIEDNIEEKILLLMGASAEMDECIRYCTLASSYKFPMKGTTVARCRLVLGETLNLLYDASKDYEHLFKAISVYEEAIKDYETLKLNVRIAELFWKKAKNFLSLGDSLRASDEFLAASERYLKAIEKIPQLEDYYTDYSKYMQAWSSIEKARYYHSLNQLAHEKEEYDKAADLHASTKKWNYLTLNYRAWARLAEAEDLSRTESTEKAKEMFVASMNLFRNAKKSIEEKLEDIDEPEEKEMVSNLIEASDLRTQYCQGRIALEEARILDRKGESQASSDRYSNAEKTFQDIIDSIRSERERNEILPLLSLCKAWKKMTLAQALSSPELYFDAALLFDEAGRLSFNEKSKLLTMGHSNFCKALGAITRYEASREKVRQQEFLHYLSTASNYYVRAGFETASEYSKGTQHLFNAYDYIYEANTKTSLSEKARLYKMAETVLTFSADSFKKTGYTKKVDEVQRLLSIVQQDKELVISLSQILDTPQVSSSTESFNVPTPSHEQPVGLGKFEYANIESRVLLSSETVTSGEEFIVGIEVFNTGNTAATLVAAKEVISSDFEVTNISGYYTHLDGDIDFKGKKIGPLGVVEAEIRIRPLSKGDYEIKPKIVFLDDEGKYKESEADPAYISVREMGILSWLRGARPSF